MRTLVVQGVAIGAMQLESEVAHYAARVLRLAPGTEVYLLDPRAKVRARATLTSVTDGVTVTVHEIEPAPLRRPLVLLQGLPKGDKSDAIVQDATELGATEIAFVCMRHSVRVIDDSRRERTMLRWKKIAEESARQCERIDVPILSLFDDLESAAAHVSHCARFALYEKAHLALRHVLEEQLSLSDPLAFLVGPEGGFHRDEVAFLENERFHLCSLGDTILRTETVATTFLGAVRVWS
jgi:16S rRNA (uracil1498-N3)-methyltransferase